MRKLGIYDLVTFAAGDDAALAAHYEAAVALLYPSVDEGSGVSATRGDATSLSVAAARAGAIPEVVDDAALLFDPLDVEATTQSIDRLLDGAELRVRLTDRGWLTPLACRGTPRRGDLAAYSRALEHRRARS